MRFRGSVYLAGAVALAVAWNPARAHACSCSLQAIFPPPEDELRDLPLNAAPIIQGVFTPGSLTIQDEFGEAPDVTINEGPLADAGCTGTWVEIIPNEGWKPRPTYIVRVSPAYAWPNGTLGSSVTFVTGADFLPEPELKRPKARIAIIDHVSEFCGAVHTLGCLSVEGKTSEQPDLELIVRRGDSIRMRRLIVSGDVTVELFALPDCLELRQRAPTGKRSEPLVLCGDELNVRDLRSGEAEGGSFVCKNAAHAFKPTTLVDLGSQAGAAGSQPSAADAGVDDARHQEWGCSAVSGGPRHPYGALPLLLVARLVRRFSRRRRDRPA